MKKNVASQTIGAQMVSATDGSAFTGTVSVAVTGDAGTQGAGGGSVVHEGNGYHSYAPTQAETNFDHVAFTFTGTGAIPVTVQVYTSFPQTGDSFARLGAPAGASVSADVAAVKSDTAAILADTGTDGVVVSGASVRTAVGLAAANLDTQLGAIDDFIDTEVAAILAAVDTEVAAIKAKTDNLPVDPADASDIAASFTTVNGKLDTIDDFLDTEIAAILEDTGTTLDDMVDDLETRLTAALATALQAHGLGIGRGVVGAGSTTTAIVFGSVNGAAPSATNDFYNGRHIVFTSGALTLQATSISDYVGATTTATVPAVTGAPAQNDTFIIV